MVKNYLKSIFLCKPNCKVVQPPYKGRPSTFQTRNYGRFTRLSLFWIGLIYSKMFFMLLWISQHLFSFYFIIYFLSIKDRKKSQMQKHDKCNTLSFIFCVLTSTGFYALGKYFPVIIGIQEKFIEKSYGQIFSVNSFNWGIAMVIALVSVPIVMAKVSMNGPIGGMDPNVYPKV